MANGLLRFYVVPVILFEAHLLIQIYPTLYEFFGGEKNWHWLAFVGSNVAVLGAFAIVGGLLLYTDVTGKPSWMLKYKVQPGQNQPVDIDKLKKAFRTICLNMLIINPLTSIPLFLMPTKVPLSYRPEDLPPLWRFLLEVIFCALIVEILFYASHRMLHHPYFYKTIHKQHHEWTAPIGVIAVYAHPVEFILGNVVPVVAGPILARAHVVTFCAWLAIALTSTAITHSGYHIPFLPSPQFHDYHHLKFNVNYGSRGWVDRLLGTDAMFKDSVQGKRHQMLLTTKPAQFLYPDPPGDKVKTR